MKQFLMDVREDGPVSIWDRHRARQYVRIHGSDDTNSWLRRTPAGDQTVSDRRARQLERLYRHCDELERVHRHPRLHIRRYARRNAEDIAFFRAAKLIAEIEKEAIKWIGRGREANIELGRRFIRLKDLIEHGHFEAYYERTFGQPYGIQFRTAQAYMKMAREQDEARGADSALFPLAMDPQAVEIREATKNHAAAIAELEHHSSGDDSSKASTEVVESGTDMCTCRLSIRMTRDQRQRVAVLWKSEHRALAEAAATTFLMEFCDKYESIGGDSGEGEADA